MKVKYYNLTYNCNSSCLFCAANIGLIYRDEKDIQLSEFIESIEKDNLTLGDRIILNGGEPTLCPDFVRIVEFCDSRDYVVDLYTNGKRFSDAIFCDDVFKDGKYYVRIPIFGRSDLHNMLTGNGGNFEATIDGINNLVNTKAYKDRRLTIEIKLLLAKCCVDVFLMELNL